MNMLRAINMRLLGALVVLGCTLAFNAHWITQEATEMGGDEFEYDMLARHIITGQGFALNTGQSTAYRTPGFPLILGSVYYFCDGNIAVARIILAILTSLTSLGIYGICLAVFNDLRVALMGGLSWALMVMTINLSGLLYGESSAGLILIASLFLSSLSKKYESDAYAGAAGLLMGFAILTRGYLLPVIAGPFIWLLFWKKRLAFVLLLFAVLIPVLWIARNGYAVGAFTFSTETSIGLWAGNNAWTRGAWAGSDWLSPDPQQLRYLRERHYGFEQMNEVERSKVYAAEFINEVSIHPMRIAWLIPRKIAIYLSPLSYLGNDWVYAALLPFSLLGLLWLWNDKEARHLLWLIGFPIIGVMIVCVLTFGDARFRHPVNPLFAILAAIGLKTSVSHVLVKLGLQQKWGHYLGSPRI